MKQIKRTTDPSLLFIKDKILGKNQVKMLNGLGFSETGARRLCFHSSNESLLHVMAVQTRDGEVFPRHAHLDSDELIVVIQGTLRIRIWLNEDDEEPVAYFLGTDLNKCDCAAICIPRWSFHDTMAAEPDTVYLESKLGPFKPESTLRKTL